MCKDAADTNARGGSDLKAWLGAAMNNFINGCKTGASYLYNSIVDKFSASRQEEGSKTTDTVISKDNVETSKSTGKTLEVATPLKLMKDYAITLGIAAVFIACPPIGVLVAKARNDYVDKKQEEIIEHNQEVRFYEGITVAARDIFAAQANEINARYEYIESLKEQINTPGSNSILLNAEIKSEEAKITQLQENSSLLSSLGRLDALKGERPTDEQIIKLFSISPDALSIAAGNRSDVNKDTEATKIDSKVISGDSLNNILGNMVKMTTAGSFNESQFSKDYGVNAGVGAFHAEMVPVLTRAIQEANKGLGKNEQINLRAVLSPALPLAKEANSRLAEIANSPIYSDEAKSAAADINKDFAMAMKSMNSQKIHNDSHSHGHGNHGHNNGNGHQGPKPYSDPNMDNGSGLGFDPSLAGQMGMA